MSNDNPLRKVDAVKQLIQYNETVTASVSIDMIAQMLLKQMDPNNPNGPALTNIIIGHARHNDQMLSNVIGGLFGVTDKLEIEIGKYYYCNDHYYGFGKKEGSDKYSTNNRLVIGVCSVKQIDMYAPNKKVLVEFDVVIDPSGTAGKKTTWVNHEHLFLNKPETETQNH